MNEPDHWQKEISRESEILTKQKVNDTKNEDNDRGAETKMIFLTYIVVPFLKNPE